MPPFSPRFAEMAAEFYKIAWTDDGYPGRLRDDGTIWEHPLYAVYVLDDYLFQFEADPTDELRKAIGTVADAAVSRMEDFEGALVFWYEPGGGARLYERHYSALTQGYYAQRLWRAAEVTGNDALKDAARRSFLALTIPSERGGVLFKDANGISIAEVPQQPNSYILNGWQSALVGAWEYHLLSDDTEARDLVLKSAETMAALLPRYDARPERNSRYGLSGFVYLRTPDADIEKVAVTVPGEGVFGLTEHDSRWANHRVDERKVNLVFSLASAEPNTVYLKVDRSTPVELYVGSYDPLASSPVNAEWIRVGEVSPTRGELTIPSEIVEQIASPTNFVKVINGANTNVYHSIHIRRFQQLAEITGDRRFSEWADRWTQATCEWRDMPIYAGLHARPVKGTAAGLVGKTVPVKDLCPGPDS